MFREKGFNDEGRGGNRKQVRQRGGVRELPDEPLSPDEADEAVRELNEGFGRENKETKAKETSTNIPVNKPAPKPESSVPVAPPEPKPAPKPEEKPTAPEKKPEEKPHQGGLDLNTINRVVVFWETNNENITQNRDVFESFYNLSKSRQEVMKKIGAIKREHTTLTMGSENGKIVIGDQEYSDLLNEQKRALSKIEIEMGALYNKIKVEVAKATPPDQKGEKKPEKEDPQSNRRNWIEGLIKDKNTLALTTEKNRLEDKIKFLEGKKANEKDARKIEDFNKTISKAQEEINIINAAIREKSLDDIDDFRKKMGAETSPTVENVDNSTNINVINHTEGDIINISGVFYEISPDKTLIPVPPEKLEKINRQEKEAPRTIGELKALVAEKKDREHRLLEERCNESFLRRAKRFFNETDTGRYIKIGGKIFGGAALAFAAGTLTGGVGLWAAPLLYSLGTKEAIDGGIEAIQYLGFGGRRARSKIESMKREYDALYEKNGEEWLKYQNPDIERMKELVSNMNQSEIDLAKWEKKSRTIRLVASTVATIGVGVVNGIPFGMQDFDKNGVQHAVKLTTRGFEFVYNQGDLMAQTVNHIGLDNIATHTVGKVIDPQVYIGIGNMVAGLAARAAMQMRGESPKNIVVREEFRDLEGAGGSISKDIDGIKPPESGSKSVKAIPSTPDLASGEIKEVDNAGTIEKTEEEKEKQRSELMKSMQTKIGDVFVKLGMIKSSSEYTDAALLRTIGKFDILGVSESDRMGILNYTVGTEIRTAHESSSSILMNSPAYPMIEKNPEIMALLNTPKAELTPKQLIQLGGLTREIADKI
jgi:hypothetical protein